MRTLALLAGVVFKPRLFVQPRTFCAEEGSCAKLVQGRPAPTVQFLGQLVRLIPAGAVAITANRQDDRSLTASSEAGGAIVAKKFSTAFACRAANLFYVGQDAFTEAYGADADWDGINSHDAVPMRWKGRHRKPTSQTRPLLIKNDASARKTPTTAK
jgi:hypothetical protein